MPTNRLDKYISSQSGMSRKESKIVIRQGKVSVNKVVIVDPQTRVDIQLSKVCLANVPLEYKKNVYIMLNKPKGILSACTDKSRQTVIDLVDDEQYKSRKLFPVGRLDKDTTGFLIITDDGDFAHKVISHKSGIEKEYLVAVEGEIDLSIMRKFAMGITLADGTACLPAKLNIRQNSPERSVAEVTIMEGKYHQIKRMFGVVDLPVVELRRMSIGKLKLDDTLNEGEYREMEIQEIQAILHTRQ